MIRKVCLTIPLTATLLLGAACSDGDDPEADADAAAPESTSTTIAIEPAPFGDGDHMVGRDIGAGRYETKAPTAACQWEHHNPANEIKGPGHIGEGQRDPGAATDRWVLDLEVLDPKFPDRLITNGCGQWTVYEAPATPALTTLTKGTYLVGPEAKPGGWEAAGTAVTYDVYGLEGANRGGRTTMMSPEEYERRCTADPSVEACQSSPKRVGLSDGLFVRIVPTGASTLVWRDEG